MELTDPIRRAEEAQRVLKSPVFVEAWAAYEQRLLDALANSDVDERQLQRLQGYLVAARKARSHLERIVQDGRLAAAELELIEKKRRLKDIFRVA